MTASSALIRQDILPLAVGYGLLMGALAVGLLLQRRTGRTQAAVAGQESREPSPAAVAGQESQEPSPAAESASGPARGLPGPVRPDRRGWLRLVRHVAGTAVGGYLVLMAVVVAYYYGVARVPGDFIESAFTGCALLIGLSSPVFAAATWLLERRRPRGDNH
jgi:Family of unknown function (DUF6256)